MRVPDELRKCICFLEGRIGNERWVGTAFFVAVPLGVGDKDAVYVATARHCIETENGVADSIVLRLNTTGGSSDELATNGPDWILHATADVAILPLAPDRSRFDYLYYPIHSAVSDEFIAQHSIAPGEDVLITGLLVHHPGETRIMPVVRVGNLAAMPEEPVRLKTGADVVALVEVRSLGGLSGSPAFIHLPDLRRDAEGQLRVLLDGEGKAGQNYLLGVVHGFYPVSDNDPDGLIDEGSEPLNTGISVVVLAARIRALIDSPKLVAQRDALRGSLDP